MELDDLASTICQWPSWLEGSKEHISGNRKGTFSRRTEAMGTSQKNK